MLQNAKERLLEALARGHALPDITAWQEQVEGLERRLAGLMGGGHSEAAAAPAADCFLRTALHLAVSEVSDW